MTGSSHRRCDSEFAAKQMNFMTQIAQPFGCSEKIALGSAAKIEPLMNQSNLHLGGPAGALFFKSSSSIFTARCSLLGKRFSRAFSRCSHN